MFNSLRKYLISKACVLFSDSAVQVNYSQACRNMKMTRKRIRFTFSSRDISLSLQKGFFISLWIPLALFVISLVFSALISILYLVQVLSKLSTRASSSCSASVRTSMSSENRKLVIFSAAYANLLIMLFQGIRHDMFEKNVEEGG